jgi:Fe-S protein assembly co-chaperone HscB
MKDLFQTLSVARTFGFENAALERRFHKLQRESHPDRFATMPAELGSALDRSSDINLAYRILRNPPERRKHLLSLYGYSAEQSKQVPMELLEIVMNVQERVAELEFADEAKREKLIEEIEPLANDLEGRRAALDTEMRSLEKKWDVAEHSTNGADLKEEEKEILSSLAKDMAQRAYIQTLLASLEAAQKGESLVLKH